MTITYGILKLTASQFNSIEHHILLTLQSLSFDGRTHHIQNEDTYCYAFKDGNEVIADQLIKSYDPNLGVSFDTFSITT